ncbi:MAG: O-methyltransferase [Microbacterium sp.]|uniref:O-methyltransferase n=1 Tax=Microbacterium sp. TaxID=51671 RepID=UPI0039E68425
MSEPTPTRASWLAVDAYLTDTLVGHDPDLEQAVADQDAAGLASIEVAPLGGKLLHLLARIAGARRVLEIGTLGGYSTIWLARALPSDGLVVTIDADAAAARTARHSLERAGVSDRVRIEIGVAADVLPTLAGEAPFDLIFIDADKESNTLYQEWAARLGHPGTVIVVDNVARSGAVADAATTHPQILGVRAGLEMLGSDPRFDATALQTLDLKGWDGVAVAVLTDAVAG